MTRTRAAEAACALTLEKHIVNHLGGYHRCYLGDPVHIEFLSDNFCAMLGYTKTELVDLVGDVYTALLHPDDTSVFDDFCVRLAETECCESVAYRLIQKDGTVIRVVDTMASIKGDDGSMRGYSVVCEVLDDQLASKPTTPGEKIAVIKVSGGASPRIEQMCGIAKSLLVVEDGAINLPMLDFVSMVDRDRIRKALKRAYLDEHSGMEPCTIVSSEGKTFDCDLWAECIHLGDDFASSYFCIKAEIDLDYQRENKQVMSFSKVLFSSFAEDVFECDRVERSVKYICHNEESLVNALLNVRMFADDFLESFLEHVAAEDREAVRGFCLDARSAEHDEENAGPSKIKFAMTSGDGVFQSVALVMVPISHAKYFLCLNYDFSAMGAGFCAAGATVRKHVTARLFGSFCLYVDGEAVHIRSEKAREMLALLIERRGAFLTTRDAITALWECEPDEKSRARCRKIASRLMAELRKLGIDYIVESDRGARRIVPEFIECDYYDYRDGAKEASGPLLPEYSWSEYIRLE